VPANHSFLIACQQTSQKQSQRVRRVARIHKGRLKGTLGR
jgi:hypothetical protein